MEITFVHLLCHFVSVKCLRHRKTAQEPCFVQHLNPKFDGHFHYTYMVPNIMESRERQEMGGIAIAICGLHCVKNKISM